MDVDVTEDNIESFETKDDSYVYELFDGMDIYLCIGKLRIKITEQQANKIRCYYENT